MGSLKNKSSSCRLVPPSLATVVVVHGWASKRFDMWLFCRRLRNLGYQVINWGYPSVRQSIDDHAMALSDMMRDIDLSSGRIHLHLVGHSMGGIVIRRALLNAVPDNLSRVVMLASPNGGSFVARNVSPWFGWISNTLKEIGDAPESYVNSLGDLSHLEVGVLAASRDRVIHLDKVHITGETDFAVIDSGHGIMPWKQSSVVMTHRFLMTGKFSSRFSQATDESPHQSQLSGSVA